MNSFPNFWFWSSEQTCTDCLQHLHPEHFHIMSCYTVNFWLTVPACQRGSVVQWEARLTEKTQHPISFGQKFAEIFEEENSEIQFSSIVLI